MPKHILIVDDQPEFREIFSMELTKEGFEVSTAGSGSEGVATAKAKHPDLILLDMDMPGMNGAEVLDAVKSDPATRDIKVVFLSNLGRPESEHQELNDRISREAGAAGYLKKTADLNLLVADIREFLGQSAGR